MATATKAAAKPKATNQGSPESVAQRSETRKQNSTLSIDYGSARDGDSFSATGRQSFWVLKLNKLAEDCADSTSDADYGLFYQIGSFGTASTAQSTKKRIEDEHANQLVGVFELRAERTAEGSALFAAAFDNEAADDIKPGKVTPDNEGDWETE